VRLRAFVRAAQREFEAIPAEFRAGIGGPVVIRKAKSHPRIPGYYTLGQCAAVPRFGDPLDGGGDHLSTIFLYYGSFVACSMRDPDFDVEAEIRETVRHEIRHHIEDRAGAPDLRNEDLAEEQDERRRQGMAFRAGYHRLGERVGEGLWRIHADLFLEVLLSPREVARARAEGLGVRWAGSTLRIDPAGLARLPAYVPFEGEGEEGRGDLVVVVRNEGPDPAF
jgi:hypothetical protein